CSHRPNRVASAVGRCQPRALTSLASTAPNSCGSRESGPGPDQRRRVVRAFRAPGDSPAGVVSPPRPSPGRRARRRCAASSTARASAGPETAAGNSGSVVGPRSAVGSGPVREPASLLEPAPGAEPGAVSPAPGCGSVTGHLTRSPDPLDRTVSDLVAGASQSGWHVLLDGTRYQRLTGVLDATRQPVAPVGVQFGEHVVQHQHRLHAVGAQQLIPGQ